MSNQVVDIPAVAAELIECRSCECHIIAGTAYVHRVVGTYVTPMCTRCARHKGMKGECCRCGRRGVSTLHLGRPCCRPCIVAVEAEKLGR